ncbi:hypothetical protein Hypma_015092 [Hypsizygus marmoreus]|uniref:Uncharacterized protein n=1 Tax=Hypsizygus marmoreus TaxID=39966 RepID=A0A369K1I5_HYPMA|nr:hypothetical protein Hypma_015092 [Hypsizygus marmoreus]
MDRGVSQLFTAFQFTVVATVIAFPNGGIFVGDPIYFTQGFTVVHHYPPVSCLNTGVIKGHQPYCNNSPFRRAQNQLGGLSLCN